jgi:Protein of unknown function (DUF3313)
LCRPGNNAPAGKNSRHKPAEIQPYLLLPHCEGEVNVRSSSKALNVSRWSIASGLIAAVALTGCASTPPLAFHELPSASKLQPVKDRKDHFLYANPASDLRNYTALIIDPVTIYTGSDSQFGSVPDDARLAIADYMHQQFTEVLGKNLRITDSVAPHTARFHLTLIGIETSTPVLSTATHVLPVALLVNAGLGASGHNSTYDGATGELLYGSVSRETPFALDVTASVGRLDAAKAGVRRGAQHLRNDLGSL